ncbi:MAG: hypothetical protein LQ350_001269 [Teloschistes chrysophthalmus]|nr:MAG: hypothetical protein LQ350_001269 [Niorma chrysophthalma]
MIVRQAIIRHGRRLATPSLPPLSRPFASTTDDISNIQTSLDRSLQQTHSLEALMQNMTAEPIPPIDNETHATPPAYTEYQQVADSYSALQRQKAMTSHLGTTLTPHYQPHTLLTNPPSPSEITLPLLLASQSHLGHSTSLWNPANSRYIFGIRSGIHIISLDVTAAHLRRACKIVRAVAERGGIILFVGTRKGQDRCVVKAGQLARGCHLFERWTPGSITNGHQILGRCKMRVVDEFDRPIPGYESELLERPALKPDLVVCLNPLENWVMLHECGLHGIPTIGVIDTDADPTWVTYPIPANDDSLRCVQLIAGVLGRAGEEGQKRRAEKARSGEVTYQPEGFEVKALETGVRTGGDRSAIHHAGGSG